MLLFVTVVIAALASLAGLDGPARRIAPPPSAPASAAAAPTTNPWVEPARDVLSHSACGNCHRPGLPTSNPRALAIFNLHEPVWYGSMTDDQLRSLSRRMERASGIEPDDQNSVIAFVNCKLDGACDPTRSKESP